MGRKLPLLSLLLIGLSLFLLSPLAAAAEKPAGSITGGMPPHLLVAMTLDKYSDVDVKDAKAALNVWIDMIARKTGSTTRIELVIYDDLGRFEKDIKGNKIDLLFLFPQEFLYFKDRIPFEPIAISTPLGADQKHIAILVRKDRGITAVKGLASGEGVMETGENSTLISLWLETLLMKEGYSSPGTFFANFKMVKKASQALLPVFFKQADACAVSQGAFETMKELNPQIGQELFALVQSAGFPQGVICLRKGLAGKYRSFVEEMYTLHNLSQGKQILTLMRIKKLLPFQDTFMKTTEALLAENQALKLKLARKN
jgi:phosphonate transport system substrate-binding protein